MTAIFDRLKVHLSADIMSVDHRKMILDEIGSYSDQIENERRSLIANNNALLSIINLIPVALFVKDRTSRFFLMNRACEEQWGMSFNDLHNTDGSQFFPPDQMEHFLVTDQAIFATGKPVDFEETFWSAALHSNRMGHTFKRPMYDNNGDVQYLVCITRDITDQKVAQIESEELNIRSAEDVRNREQAEAVLLRRNMQLSELNARINVVQEQLLQNEKMASIGQLSAGVAHEINNPIGYVHSNIGALESYLIDLFQILDAYASTENVLMIDPAAHAELQRLKVELNLDFLRTDILQLIAESKEGISRVKKIVQDLKDFSHVSSSQEWQWVDLHQGLNSTLNVVNNEIKFKADVVKEFGVLPEIECLPSEINQVFLNLLVNAAHALSDVERGIITLRSGCDNLNVWIEIADTGSGIAPENLKRIFDPFFTTKPIGKGTGLGLSLSYGIVTKHGGRIEVDSKVGKGTTFRVILPQQQSHESTQEEAP